MSEQATELKRFTFDLPPDLHRRVKMGCANAGLKMTDVIRALLEQHFPATTLDASEPHRKVIETLRRSTGRR
jgi:hypothetical protein